MPETSRSVPLSAKSAYIHGVQLWRNLLLTVKCSYRDGRNTLLPYWVLPRAATREPQKKGVSPFLKIQFGTGTELSDTDEICTNEALNINVQPHHAVL